MRSKQEMALTVKSVLLNTRHYHQRFSVFLTKTLHYLVSINFRIKPLNNQREAGESSWCAPADDPQLLLKSHFFLKGWYFIELEVKYPNHTSQTAKLYPHDGKGFDEKIAISITHRQHKPTYKVIYLPKKTKSIRFDPVETKIDFTIKQFKIYRIPQIEAIRIILKRISHLHSNHNHKSSKENKQTLITLRKKNKQDWRDNILSIYEETFSSTIQDISYEKWIENVEPTQFQESTEILESLTYKPLISILLPCYNSNLNYLEQCIKSVQKQSYTNWQLCITDDASPHVEHLVVIQEAKKNDARIKFTQKTKNGHISACSNTCLSMATGHYVLLLDHDDLLPEHSLLYLVNALQGNDDFLLIYADEDKVDDSANRFDPHFKPEWNQDLLYSQNYIGHPVLFKTQRVNNLGGFRIGTEGSQDHDLLLRYTANITASQVHRIPKILYHWRVHKESTAAHPDAKDYTTQAGIKALQHIFSTLQYKIKISQGEFSNTYRIHWPLPEQLPLVTLIVPTHNGYEILKTCITSILEKTNYKSYEILIVNNRTDCELTLSFIKNTVQNNHQVQMINWDYPFNFSAINNFAASHAKGSIIGLINNDIEVISPDWLTEMVSHAIRPDIGCVGSKLYYPNNTVQHAGVILGIGGIAGHAHKYYDKQQPGYFSRLHLIQNLSAVTAACLIVRKEIYDQVSGLDQKNLPIAFNDVDFCIRVREAGYRNLWTPYAELYHHESVSRGAEDTPEKQKRAITEIKYMQSKWGELLQKDPAYNPNLTLDHEDFSLKIPRIIKT